MLHDKYLSSSTLGFLKQDFLSFYYSGNSENRTPMGLVKKFGFQRFPEIRGLG
jgi:hypothetical protein